MNHYDYIVSMPLTLIPFLQNNDGTRMQMASNQMRQALDIYHSEHPLVETGLERYFTNHSDLTVVSPYNGIVLAVDQTFIVLKLDEAEYGICDIKVIPAIRHKYKMFCIPGQRIKIGDILGKAPRHNNNSFKSILNGTNLLTAINGYYGYNYEDAIVISESCFNKLAHEEVIIETVSFNSRQIPLSLVENDYIPLLEPGQEIKVGDLLVRIKNSDLTNINELISQPIEKRSSYDGVIQRVDIYINNYHDSTRELSLYLNRINNNNLERLNRLLTKVCSVYNAFSSQAITRIEDLPKHIVNEIQYLSGLTKCQKWKFKNVEVDVLIKYTIVKKAKFNIGDKMANRHGNKGTIPLIVPDKDIFQVGGKPVDIIVNIMGIPGRMNIGQVYELWMTNVVNKVKAIAKAQLAKNDEITAREVIKDFYNTIDKTDEKFIFKSIDYSKDITHLLAELSFVSPPFVTASVYELKDILAKYNVPTLYDVYDPATKSSIKMPVGYMFWEKLHHLSEEKISARSFGGYNKKTMQPLSGKKMKGGQKFGEMEVWALIAHDANNLLEETLGLKSDDVNAKNKALKSLLERGKATLTKGTTKSSVVFKTYLQALGLDLIDEPGTKKKEEFEVQLIR